MDLGLNGFWQLSKGYCVGSALLSKKTISSAMKIKFNKILKYLLISIPGIFLLLVCIPRSYPVPKMGKNADMQFWNLPTGSKIGYAHIPGKGTRKSSPIIFLNGGPGGFITDIGIQLRSALSALGYDVYMYDQIGSGQSDRLAHISEYTADRHKKDLEAIIEQIGADQVILIGQSWGAVLAVLYAADHPSKIEKMIFFEQRPNSKIFKNYHLPLFIISFCQS